MNFFCPIIDKIEQCEVFGPSQNIEQFKKVNSVKILGPSEVPIQSILNLESF